MAGARTARRGAPKRPQVARATHSPQRMHLLVVQDTHRPQQISQLPASPYATLTHGEDHYTRLASHAVAAVLKQAGFEGARPEALSLLTSVVQGYLCDVGSQAVKVANHAGRTLTNLADTRIALMRYRESVAGLLAYLFDLREANTRGAHLLARQILASNSSSSSRKGKRARSDEPTKESTKENGDVDDDDVLTPLTPAEGRSVRRKSSTADSIGSVDESLVGDEEQGSTTTSRRSSRRRSTRTQSLNEASLMGESLKSDEKVNKILIPKVKPKVELKGLRKVRCFEEMEKIVRGEKVPRYTGGAFIKEGQGNTTTNLDGSLPLTNEMDEKWEIHGLDGVDKLDLDIDPLVRMRSAFTTRRPGPEEFENILAYINWKDDEDEEGDDEETTKRSKKRDSQMKRSANDGEPVELAKKIAAVLRSGVGINMSKYSKFTQMTSSQLIPDEESKEKNSSKSKEKVKRGGFIKPQYGQDSIYNVAELLAEIAPNLPPPPPIHTYVATPLDGNVVDSSVNIPTIPMVVDAGKQAIVNNTPMGLASKQRTALLGVNAQEVHSSLIGDALNERHKGPLNTRDIEASISKFVNSKRLLLFNNNNDNDNNNNSGNEDSKEGSQKLKEKQALVNRFSSLFRDIETKPVVNYEAYTSKLALKKRKL